jgi:hypothetical protein
MRLAFLHTEYLIPGMLGLLLIAILSFAAIVWWLIKFWEDRKKRKK